MFESAIFSFLMQLVDRLEAVHNGGLPLSDEDVRKIAHDCRNYAMIALNNEDLENGTNYKTAKSSTEGRPDVASADPSR